MKIRFVLLPFLFGLVLAGSAAAQGPVPTQRIDSLVAAYEDARLFSGAVLVGRGDSVAYARTAGHANREWDVPNSLDTRYRIGSVTKQFTAALILTLVEEGEVALDSTISTYLPDYPGPGADRITIHHLLTHRSGIPSFTGFADYQSRIMRLEWEPDSLVSEFASRDLAFEPGTQWAYSNSGYFLLGVVAREVTGMHYADALRETVLAPLDLDGPIGYDFSDEVIERMASGYEQTVWGYRQAEPIESSVPLSAGMLYATPEGLHRWTRALHTSEVLPDSLYRAMTTPHSENGYGYGVFARTDTIDGTPVSTVSHGGGINGFTSSLRYGTPGDYTIVVLDNTMSEETGRMATGIQKLLYGGSPGSLQPSVARVLWEVVTDEGPTAAVERYQTLKREQPGAYEYGMAELVRLGDALRDRNEPEAAVSIYEFAVSTDSTNADAHAGLGLAHRTSGNRSAAETHLTAALDQNPGHAAAKRALQEMGVEVEQTDVDLSAELLERYTGVYAAVPRPDFKMTVTRDGQTLYTQATGQQKIKVEPVSDTRFAPTVIDAQIEFTVDGDGDVPKLTLYQGGQEIVFKRVDESR